jgi:flavin-binding protein dodecin
MEKHLMITGSSNISWKDAIVRTVEEASKTLDYLTGVTIISQKAKINGKKISEYYVDLDLTFMIDRERE